MGKKSEIQHSGVGERQLHQFEFYTASEAKSVWKKPLPQNVTFDEGILLPLFNEKMLTPYRFDTGLPKSHQSYVGKWNSQGMEPTCAAWAFANAHRVLGIKPDFLLLSDLLNYANGYNDFHEQGLNSTDMHILTSTVSKPKVSFVDIPKEFRRGNIRFGKKDIMQNAEVIKEGLDSGNTLFVSLSYEKYTHQPVKGNCTHENHAICLSGYHVNNFGEMNVQIIDSAAGILWTSIEHLSTAVMEDGVHQIKPLV